MGRVIRRLLWLLILVPGIAGIATAENWERFRGPNGTGVAGDKEVPITWDERRGLLWKVELPGGGNSSPVVWGNRLFTQAASADGSKRMLLCLDVRTGKLLWSKDFPGLKAKTHVKNTLASSTPATDGERVYAAFWDGADVTMVAYDFKGTLLWRHDLGRFVSQHGAGASPVVYNGRVYFNNDQDGSASLLALDASTGKTAWQMPRGAYRACYSSPFLVKRGDFPPELVLSSTGGITSYDPESGRVNWHWQWIFDGMALRTTASPIYAHGMIFACSGDGGGDRHMVALRLENSGNFTHPVLAWENKKMFPYVPTLLAHGPNLYFVNDKGIAGCYVARTGEKVWTQRLEGVFFASPVLIFGRIYAASEDGDVYVFDAESKFHLLAKTSLGERVVATPAVANNRLFIRGENHLFCIGNKSAVN